jgi:hypothetical protein
VHDSAARDSEELIALRKDKEQDSVVSILRVLDIVNREQDSALGAARGQGSAAREQDSAYSGLSSAARAQDTVYSELSSPSREQVMNRAASGQDSVARTESTLSNKVPKLLPAQHQLGFFAERQAVKSKLKNITYFSSCFLL